MNENLSTPQATTDLELNGISSQQSTREKSTRKRPETCTHLFSCRCKLPLQRQVLAMQSLIFILQRFEPGGQLLHKFVRLREIHCSFCAGAKKVFQSNSLNRSSRSANRLSMNAAAFDSIFSGIGRARWFMGVADGFVNTVPLILGIREAVGKPCEKYDMVRKRRSPRETSLGSAAFGGSCLRFHKP